MNREEILTTAINLTMGDRNDQNGDPLENHQRIARIWSVLLGIEVEPYQVALCMAGLKLARLAYNPLEDSFVDGAAYLAIAGEIVNRKESDEASTSRRCRCR